MTPLDSLLVPGPWPDVLAAYVDGELDPAARAVVERWLAAHPQMMDEVQAQRQFSPDNWPLWQQVEPPFPKEAAWDAVREAVHRGLDSPPMPAPVRERIARRRTGVFLAGGVAVVVAALGFIAILGNPFTPSHQSDLPEFVPNDLLTEYAVLPLATDADLDIDRIAGSSQGLIVGDPPLALASEGDIQLAEVEPHPAWPGGSPKMTTAPGDMPMIFAARLR